MALDHDENLTEEEKQMLEEFEQMLTGYSYPEDEDEEPIIYGSMEAYDPIETVIQVIDDAKPSVYCSCSSPKLVKSQANNISFNFCKLCKKEHI